MKSASYSGAPTIARKFDHIMNHEINRQICLLTEFHPKSWEGGSNTFQWVPLWKSSSYLNTTSISSQFQSNGKRNVGRSVGWHQKHEIYIYIYKYASKMVHVGEWQAMKCEVTSLYSAKTIAIILHDCFSTGQAKQRQGKCWTHKMTMMLSLRLTVISEPTLLRQEGASVRSMDMTIPTHHTPAPYIPPG